jgi:hypothetical protein
MTSRRRRISLHSVLLPASSILFSRILNRTRFIPWCVSKLAERYAEGGYRLADAFCSDWATQILSRAHRSGGLQIQRYFFRHQQPTDKYDTMISSIMMKSLRRRGGLIVHGYYPVLIVRNDIHMKHSPAHVSITLLSKSSYSSIYIKSITLVFLKARSKFNTVPLLDLRRDAYPARASTLI